MKIALVLAPLVCVSVALAQQQHVVRAEGEATVTAKPDRVVVSIGVVTHAPSASESSARNAARSTQVLQALKTLLEQKGEVQTAGYSISADYTYAPNVPPKLNGYITTNLLQVTLEDIALTGKLLDAATASGANNINNISFVLRDEANLRTKAIAEASAAAKANAEAIAGALNLQVKGVVEAATSEAAIRPIAKSVQSFSPAMAVRAESPIEPGDIEVHATVNVTLLVE